MVKKTVILFIAIVLALVFGFTRPTEFNEENVVTNEVLQDYRNRLENLVEKHGLSLTEEQKDKMVEEQKEMTINIAKSNAEGMDFIPALILSLQIAVGLFFLLILMWLHRRELFGRFWRM